MALPAVQHRQNSISGNKVYFSVEVLEDYDGRRLHVPKPDMDGYYTLVVGSLNARSRNQCYYDNKSIYDQITMETSPFNMMITQGHLYGEWGHPPVDAPIERIEQIDEKQKSHHIRKVYCGEENSNGEIPIFCELKPVLPNGPALEQSIQNKWENTAFSLRSLMKFTWDAARKAQYRTIVRLVTFDYVNTPGILQASKRYAPGEEHFIVGREIQINEFFKDNGQRIAAFESLSVSDLAKLFDIQEFTIRNIKNARYIKNTNTFIDHENKKRSLIHSLLMQ